MIHITRLFIFDFSGLLKKITKTRIIMKYTESITAVICSLLFILYISVPFMAKTFSFGKQTSEMVADAENRTIAEFPSFDIRSFRYRYIRNFPTKFESYLSDTFPYRLSIITALKKIQTRFIHKPNEKGVIGQDNWLFGNKMGGVPVDDYLGNLDKSNSKIHHMIDSLEKKRQFFDGMGIKYYFFIAPNKITIHDEMLPEIVQKSKGISFRSEFMKIYNAQVDKGIIPDFVIDPTKHLISMKNTQGFLYFPQDSHWNWKGRMIAGSVLWDQIRRDFPELDLYPTLSMPLTLELTDLIPLFGIKIEPSSNNKFFSPDPEQWNQIGIFNKEGQPSKPQSEFTHYSNNKPDARLNALIVGDSFLFGFQPFPEALRFKNLWFQRAVKNNFGNAKRCHELLSGKKVDIVVEETVERYLSTREWYE